MKLNDFIKSNDVEMASKCIASSDINKIESKLSFQFGPELKNYIKQYGYLAYKHVEFMGITSALMERSDMVKQTLWLHSKYPETSNYILLESQGDGFYIIVDKKDNVYEFDDHTGKITFTKKSLNDYIVSRFEQADNYKDSYTESSFFDNIKFI